MKYWRSILCVFSFFVFAGLTVHHIKRPLGGASNNIENPDFSIESWFSGKYQEKKEKHLSESFCFRNPCIRINNQIYFSLFDKVKVQKCILGRKNYLYEEDYIDSYFGDDFIGKKSINEDLKKFKFLQDTLAKLNKNLVLIIAPDKAHFFPEYFPEKFDHKKIKSSNYEYYKKATKEWKINHIDFNNYFVSNKYHFKYPVFPQGGIHWSYYAALRASDSIVHYIEDLRKINMPDIQMGNIELSTAIYNDYDIGNAANLLFPLGYEKLAYPEYHFESDSGKTLPSIFVISDSFYHEINRFLKEKYTVGQSWYFYNRTEIFEDKSLSINYSAKALKDRIMKEDVIIIMTNDVNLNSLGFGFIDQAYSIFHK